MKPYSKRLNDAIQFATERHGCQTRKYTLKPYIEHPLAVMNALREIGCDEDVLIAAVCHDLIEDTPTELDEIRDRFGVNVAELVFWLTDQSKPSDGNRRIRKEIDRQHIARAPAAAKTIKLADLIDNSLSIREHDPDFWRVYRHEKLRLLEVLKDGSSELWLRAFAQCEK